MKNKYIIKTSALLFFCTFFISSVQGQGQCNLYEISLEEQVAQSSQIVEGKVISKQSYWDEKQQTIYTVNTIEVYKVFKGQAHQTIDVITEGGVVDLQAVVVSPSLDLSKLDEGIFMLYPNDIEFLGYNASRPQFKIYSSVQGFYRYELSNNTAINPFNVKKDIENSLYKDIFKLTNKQFVILKSNNISQRAQQINSNRNIQSITSISPTVASAGTKTLLTINGSGFIGALPGTVSFPDGNNGGSSYFTGLDSQLISWTDTQIIVEIPSRAGTGPVRVTNAVGSQFFSQSLLIEYAQINVSTSFGTGTETAYQTQHYNQNFIGGMTWQMNTSFDVNLVAKNSFLRAFDSWVCETGVNWVIGTPTGVNTIALDGINIIRFDVGGELAPGILGVNTTYFSGCNNGGTIQWFVNELDIVFNDTTNWQYGPASANGAQIDFETVAVHELGHGHQLAHVIDTNKIMHFSVGNGINNRILSLTDIAGGNNVQNRSTTTSVCGNGLMTNSSCSLSVDDFFLSDNISIYPNPTNATLFINNPTGINLSKGTIYDISGRLITTINSNLNNSLTPINVNEFASGVYFLKLDADSASTTFKFIVE